MEQSYMAWEVHNLLICLTQIVSYLQIKTSDLVLELLQDLEAPEELEDLGLCRVC